MEANMFTDIDFSTISIRDTLLCVGAFLYHFLEKWGEYRERVERVGLAAYWNAYPVKNSTALMATALAFLGAISVGWMNPLTAIASGYMGDSVIRRLLGKFEQDKT